MNPLPQNTSSDAVLQSQTFWRLKTPLEWPGGVPNGRIASAGIFESESSSLAICLGPDSDIANVQVTYLDPTIPAPNVRTAIISPDRSLVGRIDARLDIAYPSSGGRKGRILFSSKDVLPLPSWKPNNFGVGDVLNFQRPVLDVIQYLNSPPSLIAQRSDRIFRFQYFQPPTGGHTSWMLLPAYGRKSGYFSFQNRSGVMVTVVVYGVRLSPSQHVPAASVDATFTRQLDTNAMADGADADYVFKSSADGLWDMFLLKLDGYTGGALPTYVQLSDDIL